AAGAVGPGRSDRSLHRRRPPRRLGAVLPPAAAALEADVSPRALLLVLAAAALTPGGPGLTRVQEQGKGSLWLDRPAADPWTVKLSETLTIVMRLEGEAPLDVEFTAPLRSTDGWY